MKKYEMAFRTRLISFTLMLILVIGLNILPENILFEIENSDVFKIILGSISLVFCVSGVYLWVTGFTRFKSTIGYYGPKWLAYVVFTFFSAFYLHYAYTRLGEHS